MKLAFLVYRHNTTALLSPVLKGVQAIISQACCILNTIYSKHTTLVMQLVFSEFTTLTHLVVRFFVCSIVISSDRRESRNLSDRFLHSLRSVEMTEYYSPRK